MLPIILLNSIIFSLVLFLNKVILDKVDNYVFFCIESFLIFIFSLFLLIFRKNIISNIKSISSDTWIKIIVLVVLIVSNLLLWYYLISKNEIHIVSVIKYPVALCILVIIAYFFQKKQIKSYEIAGIVLVIIGVILVTISKNRDTSETVISQFSISKPKLE